ncbi:VOC family protein [Edaphobacter bradus]|uniref:hypothetical protein n=1 Tax=Edaphobacter bradus TaxID=2259016 RepID=UPI0021E02BDC|nr:hypothetical protein [Edaphobacter bradus]
MSSQAKACTSTVIPSLRYRDAVAGIDWLVRAFGLEKKAVYMGRTTQSPTPSSPSATA